MTRGKLLILSGPSGVGKSTAIQAMLAWRPDMYFSISVTTRPMRAGDADGVTYWFKTRTEFERMIAEGAFYEYAEYAGNYYGTPKAPVEAHLATGGDVIMDIDVQGAKQLRERCADAVLVFLVAPSFAELEKRLHGRGDTAEMEIEQRLRQARWEYSQGAGYDYIVVSGDPARTQLELQSILIAEKCKMKSRQALLELEETL